MADRREIKSAQEDFAAKVAELDRIEAETLKKQDADRTSAEVTSMFDIIKVPETQAPVDRTTELLGAFDILPPRVEGAPRTPVPEAERAAVAVPAPSVSPAPADGDSVTKGFFGSLAAPATTPLESRVSDIDAALEQIQDLKNRQSTDSQN